MGLGGTVIVVEKLVGVWTVDEGRDVGEGNVPGSSPLQAHGPAVPGLAIIP